MDLLVQLFSAFCGQAPAHTWMPGGDLLPCCQRCTGLYAGALCAAALHLLCRPRLTARLLEVHGAFLLLMVPFGFHWLPQGAAARAVTGVLFGAGLVTFLQLPLLSSAWFRARRERTGGSGEFPYFGGLLLTALLLPWAGVFGGRLGFLALSLASAGGALVLCLLLLADAALLLSRAAALVAGPARRKAGP